MNQGTSITPAITEKRNSEPHLDLLLRDGNGLKNDCTYRFGKRNELTEEPEIRFSETAN
jgi:hypothetical protein